MKKWLLIPITLVIIGGLCFLLFSKRNFSILVAAPCAIAAADRCFENVAAWDKWWPKNSGGYKIEGVYYNDIRLSIQCADGSRLSGDIRLAPLAPDSLLINWKCRLPLLSGDKEARSIVDTVLQSFKTFIGDSKNIYSGVNFYRTMSKDSALVQLTSIDTAYPTTAGVYARIDSLQQYISSQKAAAIDPPMLNVSRIGDRRFKVMVAIPVNKKLPGNGRISNPNFVPWKMLEGDVHGGIYTVEKAFGEMQKFKIDHNMSIMALPFQSLITDRRKEQDTTKWITIICAPIS